MRSHKGGGPESKYQILKLIYLLLMLGYYFFSNGFSNVGLTLSICVIGTISISVLTSNKAVVRLLGLMMYETQRIVWEFAKMVRNVSSVVPDRTIDRLPASKLNVLLRFIFPKKYYERTIQPTISDAEVEYVEALAEGDVWKSRFIKIRVWFQLSLILAKTPFVAVIDSVFRSKTG